MQIFTVNVFHTDCSRCNRAKYLCETDYFHSELQNVAQQSENVHRLKGP